MDEKNIHFIQYLNVSETMTSGNKLKRCNATCNPYGLKPLITPEAQKPTTMGHEDTNGVPKLTECNKKKSNQTPTTTKQ